MPESAVRERIRSVDLVRGAVMILMAIDHVRVFAGVPAGGPTPGVFFTRWITHFCAPAFIFFAGTSAFLSRRGDASPSRLLFLRGAWLILLELTVIRVAWTFNFDFAHYALAGVIWVIGWCMILMAALVRLPVRVVGWFGILVIALHDALMPRLVGLLPAGGDGALQKILYLGFFEGPIRFGPEGPNLIVLYSIIPWIGVMAAGYAFGQLLTLPAERRDRLCLRIGVGMTALFLVLRGLNLYGDLGSWPSEGMPALLSFLNTTKYPASLQFLLMTLGPTIALLPWAERVRGRVAEGVAVFGRVPFFYYLLHIPLIHALALLVSVAREGAVNPWLFANHPMGNPDPPEGYPWSLPLLYLVFAATIVLLYPLCRWYAGLKARRRDWWLRYL